MKLMHSPYRIFLLFIAFFSLFNHNTNAQIPPGDLMFVGFNADGNDGFALAALNAIPAVTTIYITDNGWNGTALATTEGTITWTVTTTIPAGNVIIFDDINGTPTVNFGTVTVAGSFNLAAGGESIYVYEGTPTIPSSFITAFSSNAYGGATNTLTGTGLTAGTNATSLTGNDDVCVYVPSSPCSGTLAPCQAQLANVANWSCEDGSGNQSNDGGIDFPSSIPLAPTVSVLPIELISFLASREKSTEVVLEWKTSSELNNDFFEIERRTASEGWESIVKKSGAGNSDHLISYSFIDKNAPQDLIYYRLSQTDLDGRMEIFQTISVHAISADNQFVVYPNPSEGIFFVRSFRINDSKIQLLDNLGRDVSHFINTAEIDKNTLIFELINLKPAIYFLQVDEERKEIVIL